MGMQLGNEGCNRNGLAFSSRGFCFYCSAGTGFKAPPRGGRRDRTLYADSPPLLAEFWPGSAGPWAPKAP